MVFSEKLHDFSLFSQQFNGIPLPYYASTDWASFTWDTQQPTRKLSDQGIHFIKRVEATLRRSINEITTDVECVTNFNNCACKFSFRAYTKMIHELTSTRLEHWLFYCISFPDPTHNVFTDDLSIKLMQLSVGIRGLYTTHNNHKIRLFINFLYALAHVCMVLGVL